MRLTKKIKQTIKNYIDNLDYEDKELFSRWLGVDYIFEELQEVETLDEFQDNIERTIVEQCTIVYHANAMEFLNKYDTSLQESLELAYNMGFEVKDMHAELLATLLLQDMLQSMVYQLTYKLKEFYT